GAVDPWSKPRYEARRKKLAELAAREGVSLDEPWARFPEDFRRTVLHGKRPFGGVIPFLEGLEGKRYKQYIRVCLRQCQSALPCPVCRGAKLREEALWVKVAGRSIAEVSAMPITELRQWVEMLAPKGGGTQPARSGTWIPVPDALYRELRSRVVFLVAVGLGYLTLDRQTRTLSGGEAQRLSLVNALGSRLGDTL